MADHKRKKKRGRSKLFKSCFRSFSDERPFINNNSDIRNFRNGRSGKPGLITASGCEGDDVIPDVNSEPSSHGRGVPRLLKAAMFGSVMMKKICSSKSSNASDTSKTFLSIKQSDDNNACGVESTDMEDSSSRCSNLLSSSSRATSSLYSSSSSSSTNSNSKWLSEPKTTSSVDTADSSHQILSKTSSLHKPKLLNSSSGSCFDQTDTVLLPVAKSNSLISRSSSSSVYNKGLSQLDSVDSKNLVLSTPDKMKSSGNSWNIRWCLFLLLSLIVLVVYGRVYAILCTSMWFYLIPCRRVKRVNSVCNAARVMDTESEQYKKRVIMAGLLDRTRNPLR